MDGSASYLTALHNWLESGQRNRKLFYLLFFMMSLFVGLCLITKSTITYVHVHRYDEINDTN